MNKPYNIAIDGPAGAGKSTIARTVASMLDFIYVDTGAMYRAMALYFLRQQISPQNEMKIAAACKDVEISLRYEAGKQQVILNGEDVSELIRSEEVGLMASSTSVYLPVRKKLLQLQQDLAARENVIMDGRDIGTCVLPYADAKIYLTADSHVRALRRFKELTEKGMMCNLEEIEQDIIERDYRDMNREHAPLKQAADAVLIDSSLKGIEEVIQEIINVAVSHGLKVDKWKS